ncbi:hypothetical protein TKK_0004897 [Trichogramma kaykai]|uniref:Gustatory receptor n=1 Tax=Trichogramma kaykai TaxID=54128 RepID=A0ABD2XIW3_9HYME
MRNLWKIENFADVMKPSLFICRLYGLLPYRMENEKITRSRLINIYCIAFTTLYLIFSMLNLYILNASSYVKRISTWMLQSNCFYALANFIIVSNAAFGSQVITILRTLEKVTRKLPKSELDKVAKWIRIKDLIVYALLIVHAPALFSGDIYNWIAKVIASYATTAIYLLDLQYSSYVYILGSCFKFINAELARLKDKAFTEKAHLLRRVYHRRFNPTLFVKLRHLKQWHYKLNEAIRKINLTFSLQIISTLILTFTELTFGLYFNIYDMRHKNVRSLNNEVWYCYYYTLVVYYTLKLFLLTLTCQFTNDENDKSHIIINEILINTDDKLFKEELYLFSLQLLHTNNTFIAKGVKIDATLLTAMAKGIFTYLLILIQFLVSS